MRRIALSLLENRTEVLRALHGKRVVVHLKKKRKEEAEHLA